MAVTILSESYGPRKPFVVCTAASTDELAAYVGLWAEGSEATISDTKYILDRTKGWVDENGGGGSGDDLFVVHFTSDVDEEDNDIYFADKTLSEMATALDAGKFVIGSYYGITVSLIATWDDEFIFQQFFNSRFAGGGGSDALDLLVFSVTSEGVSYTEAHYALTPLTP